MPRKLPPHPALHLVNRPPAPGADGAPVPPPNLSDEARAMWYRIVEDRALRDHAHLITLAEACRAFDSVRACEALIDAEGSVIPSARRRPMRNPACFELDVQRKAMLRCLAALPKPRAQP